MGIEAELQRRDPSDNLVPWKLVTDTDNSDTGLSDPVADLGARAQLAIINSLVPGEYDYIEMAYTGENLTLVRFRSGGASGAIVSTLTIAYSGDKITSVAKS